MMHQLTPTIQVNISLKKKTITPKYDPRSKTLGKKRNQRMLRKISWTSLGQKKKEKTRTTAMMGGGLTAVKMSSSDFVDMQVKRRKHGYH